MPQSYFFFLFKYSVDCPGYYLGRRRRLVPTPFFVMWAALLIREQVRRFDPQTRRRPTVRRR